MLSTSGRDGGGISVVGRRLEARVRRVASTILAVSCATMLLPACSGTDESRTEPTEATADQPLVADVVVESGPVAVLAVRGASELGDLTIEEGTPAGNARLSIMVEVMVISQGSYYRPGSVVCTDTTGVSPQA